MTSVGAPWSTAHIGFVLWREIDVNGHEKFKTKKKKHSELLNVQELNSLKFKLGPYHF